MFMYETDGSTIKSEQHKLDLSDGKAKITLTFPLKSKVKRNNTAKKKENVYGPAISQDNWLFQPSDSICSADGEFFKSDIFKTKHIECSLLWIRVDPNFHCIRHIDMQMGINGWIYQILREKDLVGQYEAIHKLKKIDSEAAYECLKYVIETDEFFYKIRQEALYAISQMNTRAFNKYLSTERFLMKVFSEYDDGFSKTVFNNSVGRQDLKYRTSAIRYLFDQTLLEVVSQQSNSSYKLVIFDRSKYNMKVIKGYTSKDLNKWLLEILKRHYSDKLIFEDTCYVANIIRACGNLLNMKFIRETVHEITRQCEVDLTRSNNVIEATCGSYNNLIIISSVEALTQIYSNLCTLNDQLAKNVEYRMKKRHSMDAETAKTNGKNLNKKIQNDKEAISKCHRQIAVIEKFMESVKEYRTCQISFEIQMLIFKFDVVSLFEKEPCMKAIYKTLMMINSKIEESEISLATGYLRTFRDYLQDRMFVKRDLDYLELGDYSSPKNKLIYKFLWDMATLDFVFTNQEFRQVIGSIMWMLYREVKIEDQKLDLNWLDYETIQISELDDRSFYDSMYDEGIINRSQTGKRRHGERESDILSDHYSVAKSHYKRGKNVITLNTSMRQPSQNLSRLGESVNKSEASFGVSEKRKKFEDEDDYEDQNVDHELIDISDLQWQDACLKVLDKLEEYDESEDFRNPVTKDEVGQDFWNAYISIIEYHVDFTTIRYKIIEAECKGVSHFEVDMRTVFSN